MAIVLFLSFFTGATRLFSEEEISKAGDVFLYHLTPDYVNAVFPMDSIKSDKITLGSILLGLTKADATFISSKNNFFAHRNNKAVGIFAEAGLSVPVSDGKKTSLVFFIPCFMTDDKTEEGRLYYAGLTIAERGETKVAVFTKEEFDDKSTDIESGLGLSPDFFDSCGLRHVRQTAAAV